MNIISTVRPILFKDQTKILHATAPTKLTITLGVTIQSTKVKYIRCKQNIVIILFSSAYKLYLVLANSIVVSFYLPRE
jgi:hypothetical protein